MLAQVIYACILRVQKSDDIKEWFFTLLVGFLSGHKTSWIIANVPKHHSAWHCIITKAIERVTVEDSQSVTGLQWCTMSPVGEISNIIITTTLTVKTLLPPLSLSRDSSHHLQNKEAERAWLFSNLYSIDGCSLVMLTGTVAMYCDHKHDNLFSSIQHNSGEHVVFFFNQLYATFIGI